MESISLNAYGKINFALDVIDRLPNGFHRVDMIMHLIELHDQVLVRWYPGGKDFRIGLKTNKYFLPVDSRNIAYKAAEIMHERFMPDAKGVVRIDIKKEIPVAAGLAGGSGNGAAVVLGLNYLWKLNLSLDELFEIGKELGSDVPFSMAGQAKVNKKLGDKINNDPLATVCARAQGTGTDLTPLPAIKSNILLSKPSISVSTAEVYKGLDREEVKVHPNISQMAEAVKDRQVKNIRQNMINVLEKYTTKVYPQVLETMEIMREGATEGQVLMSGSGPTVFSAFMGKGELDAQYEKMKKLNGETFRTRTIL